MKARLLITYPTGRFPDGKIVPFAPPLIIEDGETGMFTTTWVRHFGCRDLETLTETEIREVLKIDKTVEVYLSSVRTVPSADLFSETVSDWRQQWWMEEVAKLQQQHLAKAS